MVTLECSATASDGVTLVTAVIAGEGTARRVRLANRLDGPVWPPRRQGVPEAGWDGDEYVDTVPAGGHLAVGYASPAPPADPPLELVSTAPPGENDPGGSSPTTERPGRCAVETGSSPGSPEAVVRDLGDPSPPRDAVPVPDACFGTETSTDEGDGSTRDTGTPPDQSAEEPVPGAVASWLDDVAARTGAAERVASADTLPAATAAVEDAGGLSGVRCLARRRERDVRALRAVAERVDRLAERSTDAEVPVETFERIA